MFDISNDVQESATLVVEAPRRTGVSRRDARRDATRAEILAAAWMLAGEVGLTGLSMRELGERVGLSAASLYSYFPSKHAIHDAMFRQGYEAFLEDVAANPTADIGLRSLAITEIVRFFDFCTADTVRYQLLFQRTVPGFTPSDESYAVAVTAYHLTVGRLAGYGFSPADMDLVTGMVTGLVSQQIANDPGGTRWRDLLPRAVDALLAVVPAAGVSDRREPGRPDPDRMPTRGRSTPSKEPR